MPHQMDFTTEALQGIKPVPAGIYELRLVGFEPKTAKNGESANLNPIFAIVNNPEFDGRTLKYVFGANTKIPSFIQDMVHALGFEMEDYGTDHAKIPGIWDTDKGKFVAGKYDTYTYSGPLVNQICRAEVIESEFNGKKNNKIKKFFCKVDKCAENHPEIRHSDNVAGNA